MFKFQNLANNFAALFSLEFLWLVPFWAKPSKTGVQKKEVTEAKPERPTILVPELWRFLVGLMITLLFGVGGGALSSWAELPKIVWLIPVLGFILFVWGMFIEKDPYSRLIGSLCALIGFLWGAGATIGMALA